MTLVSATRAQDRRLARANITHMVCARARTFTRAAGRLEAAQEKPPHDTSPQPALPRPRLFRPGQVSRGESPAMLVVS